MQPIGKFEKMSSESFKNSDDSKILMEFFKNFDQNAGGKLYWPIHSGTIHKRRLPKGVGGGSPLEATKGDVRI